MDTHDQFRESERRTFWFRASVLAFAVIASAALPGASFSMLGAIIVTVLGFAAIAFAKLVLLERFRSDAWIYGQLASDAVIGAGLLAVFGPLSPALAWPLFGVAYFSLLLGRLGAVAAAFAGICSVAVALALSPHLFPVVMLIAVGGLGGTASITALLANDRFVERARRTNVEESLAHEAHSSRVLAGLMRMANARGDREVATALADAVRAASQYPAAVSFITRPSDGALVPISWRLDTDQQPTAGEALEFHDSDTPGAISARQGTAIVIDSPSGMPTWARDLGYVSGLVLPVTRGMELLGIVYALKRQPAAASVSEIEQLELVAAFASRLFSGSTAGSTPSAGMLDSFLSRRASQDQSPTQPAISMQGLQLDPSRESAEIGGISVSLSKTEFAILHALASEPSQVFDSGTLARTCWEGDPPSDNTVDVTIYRLRRKLAQVPAGHDLIQTVRGRGFKFQPPVLSATASD